jgi:hypothetical protein
VLMLKGISHLFLSVMFVFVHVVGACFAAARPSYGKLC